MDDATATAVDTTGTADATTGGDDRLGERTDAQPTDRASGQPGQEGTQGQDDGQGQPRSRAQERIQELIDRERTTALERDWWRRKAEGGEGAGTGRAQPDKGREMPPELKDLDTALGPYMKHHLSPYEQANVRAQIRHDWLVDRMEFYDDYPEYRDKKFRALIEDATGALSAKLGQRVDRADVLMYLRGHPKYGELFVDKQKQQTEHQRALTESEVDARRGAGRGGGRPPVARSREDGPVDLKSMSPAERVKYFETQRGDEPF